MENPTCFAIFEGNIYTIEHEREREKESERREKEPRGERQREKEGKKREEEKPSEFIEHTFSEEWQYSMMI